MSATASKIIRPVLRYHGGKWRLAPWIIQHLPAYRVYVEPYGGAASVLLRKPRAYAEVYNELHGEVSNLFAVLRDPAQTQELERLVRLTPFSRVEFQQAYTPTEKPVESARRLLVRSFMGFGSAGHNPQHSTGFRSNCNRSHTTPAYDWQHFPDHLSAFTSRLQGVVLECRPALDVMRHYDGPDTAHYVDPPYLHRTRTFKARDTGQVYVHEMTDADHVEMADCLHGLEGMVVLSGYPSELYAELFEARSWLRVDRNAHADCALDRVECLWLSPNSQRALSQREFEFAL